MRRQVTSGRSSGSSSSIPTRPSFLVRSRTRARRSIVSLGVVAEVKQTAKVVEAFARLASAHPAARLAIVGPAASEAEARRCRELARLFGVEDRIEITGDVDDDEFRSRLEAASLAVQLRAHSNGESQATIADCFAAGVPTIVTALGSARELPDDAVVKVEREISAQDLADGMAAVTPRSRTSRPP